jgi:hypothetical protein
MAMNAIGGNLDLSGIETGPDKTILQLFSHTSDSLGSYPVLHLWGGAKKYRNQVGVWDRQDTSWEPTLL